VTSPTAEQLAETIAHAVGLAHQLTSDARWLYQDAYWPQRKDRDRPSRPLPAGTDPDVVPGRLLDLGVGNDTARAKYTEAATKVVEAHRLAGRALTHFGGKPISEGRRRPARGDEFGLFVDSTVRRLRKLADLGVTHGPDQAKLDTQAACDTLIAAHAALRSVMRDVDGTGEAPAERRCKTCQNTAAEGRTECWRCINYRMRNKGKVRPVPRNLGAFAARDRRRERGEDHAEAPMPRGRYIDGQWTEAS
jgi:hypothetical protein